MSVLREFTLAVDEGGGTGRGGGSSQAAARPARKDVPPPAPVGVGGQERARCGLANTAISLQPLSFNLEHLRIVLSHTFLQKLNLCRAPVVSFLGFKVRWRSG